MYPKTPPQSASRKTCEFCGRAFARNEHLTRHRRTHTSEKPFQCLYCELTFSRSDVKDRHVERHHPPDDDGPNLDGFARKRPATAGTVRSKLACDECRRRKLRCDNLHPCEGCRSRGLPCTVSSSSRPPGRPRSEASNRTSLLTQECDMSAGTVDTETSQHSPPPMMAVVPPIGSQLSHSVTPSEQTRMLSNGFTEAGEQSNQNFHPAYDDAVVTDIVMGEYQVPSLEYPDDIGDLGQDWESVDFMNGFWQLPQMEGDGWLDDLDHRLVYGDFLAAPLPSDEALVPTSMQTAIGLMRDHFQRRSRAPSPTAGEAAQMWYSTQPRLQIYDKDIVNVFLNLGRRHLASTFTVFADFEANSGTSEELCLAMAAVGGLFCDVPGSTKIAKALYNDSRRILLEPSLLPTAGATSQSTDRAKTFILLEIYGFDSGDKRCFELGEALHAFLLQVTRDLYLPEATSTALPHRNEASLYVSERPVLFMYELGSSLTVSRILEALHILECYRAVLILRPPTFLPLYNKHLISNSNPRTDIDDWANDVSSLLTPGGVPDGTQTAMISLAAISCFSYMSGGRQTLYTEQPLWRPEFTEIALDRWLRAQTQPLGLPKLLLYHMTHLNIHTDLGLLQRFAQSLAKSRRSLSMENKHIHAWITGEHFTVARWHADNILRAVKDDMARCHRADKDSVLKRDRQEPTTEISSVFVEPPHLPYCTYFSILIMWYETRHVDKEPATWSACIDRLVPLLFGLKARVAKLLGNALCELKIPGH